MIVRLPKTTCYKYSSYIKFVHSKTGYLLLLLRSIAYYVSCYSVITSV
nr:MAG TPA: hypothetical protein [Caudoviricetes sp.]